MRKVTATSFAPDWAWKLDSGLPVFRWALPLRIAAMSSGRCSRHESSDPGTALCIDYTWNEYNSYGWRLPKRCICMRFCAHHQRTMHGVVRGAGVVRSEDHISLTGEVFSEVGQKKPAGAGLSNSKPLMCLSET